MDFVTENAIQITLAAILVGGWLMLRTGASQISRASALDGLSGEPGRGKPVVMEFFSNA